jgi:hypothetical protein
LLTGKAALIPGFSTFIADELKMEVVVPEHAAEATIYGLLKIGDSPEHLKTVRINTA